MTSVVSVSQELETYIQDNWSSTEIAWENVPFDPPVSDPWIRVTLSFFKNSNEGLGTNCVSYSGQIIVQIFVRYDVGTGPAISLADEMIALLQNKKIGTCIDTFESDLRKIGDAVRQMNRVQTDWYQVNVVTNFETCC